GNPSPSKRSRMRWLIWNSFVSVIRATTCPAAFVSRNNSSTLPDHSSPRRSRVSCATPSLIDTRIKSRGEPGLRVISAVIGFPAPSAVGIAHTIVIHHVHGDIGLVQRGRSLFERVRHFAELPGRKSGGHP